MARPKPKHSPQQEFVSRSPMSYAKPFSSRLCYDSTRVQGPLTSLGATHVSTFILSSRLRGPQSLFTTLSCNWPAFQIFARFQTLRTLIHTLAFVYHYCPVNEKKSSSDYMCMVDARRIARLQAIISYTPAPAISYQTILAMAAYSRFILGLAISTLVSQTSAFWTVPCSNIQTERIDPILAPGVVSGHVHKISGAQSMSV